MSADNRPVTWGDLHGIADVLEMSAKASRPAPIDGVVSTQAVMEMIAAFKAFIEESSGAS